MKSKTLKLEHAVSPLFTQYYRVRAKTGWLGIRIIFLSGTTCLLVDCCFSELASYKNPTKIVDLVQSGHHLIKML